ncbi:MAG TPA: hypothetical protein VIH22_05880, partial [Cyclobacteriaceae bacterium]
MGLSPSAVPPPPSGLMLVPLLGFLLLSVISPAQVHSPDIFLTRARDSAQHYAATRPAEKVYLHFDKSIYSARDTCWYKAYVVNASDLFPAGLSGVLYVDWIDPKGNLLSHQQLKLMDGEAHGDYSFSLNATEGTYHVRAYTQWMRNDDTDFFFSTTLSVVNVFIPPTLEASTTASSPATDLQFFPEGGTAVNGLPSRMPFKAIGPDGNGIDAEGQIVDEENRYVTFFQSVRRGKEFFPKGMGISTITPMAGKS